MILRVSSQIRRGHSGPATARARPPLRSLLLVGLLAAAAAVSASWGGLGLAAPLGDDVTIVAAGAVTTAESATTRAPEYDYDPPEPGTYRLPAIKPAGDGRVLGPGGTPARLSDLMKGHITILSFIYTRCGDPKACPAATGALYDIQRASETDPKVAKNLRLLTFSFDPEHDTPGVMEEYGRAVRSGKGGAEWDFLTTSSAVDLQPILSAYGQVVDRKKNPNDAFGPFYHVLRVYLIDRRGMIRNIYSFGMLDPRMVLADVRTLLLEEPTDTAAE